MNVSPFSKFDDVTDPKLSGPPLWYIIHSTSFSAREMESIQSFILTMKNICNNFPCKHCKGHCQDYIKKHPIEKEIDTVINGKRLGMFLWSWKFHNAVNQRLNKPIVNFETAYKMYDITDPNNAICSKNCEEAGEISKPPLEEENIFSKSYMNSGSQKADTTPSNKIYQNNKKLTLIRKK